MSNVTYDLDTSGGLMDQIQALIAPPGTADKKDKNKKNEHPYFKRPGKGHNHDYCDACGEGGDLICCDKCPSSFHLGCHDPPLDDTDIPRGDWLCHSCRYEKNQQNMTLRKRSNSTPTPSSSGPKPAKKSKMTPMEMLIEAASSMNPKQFELPRSMSMPNFIFPGADRLDLSKIPKRITKTSRDHERQSNGLVPLPAKKCAECQKSCRVAPLLACDYCPSFYHLDCLDPPLTAPPGGLWMCPQHVEHTLDSTMLTSVSVTERVKLWDKFSAPIDQDAIKIDFFRKIHRKNPPFRIKRKLPYRITSEIPEMVKYHYKKPVSLLPSLRDVLRIENINKRLALKDILRKNGEIDEKNEGEVEFIQEIETKVENDDGTEIENCDISDKNEEGKKSPKLETISNTTSINITNNTTYTNNYINLNVNNFENGCKSEINGFLDNDILIKERNLIEDIFENFAKDPEADGQIRQLDDRMLRLLAYQRAQQLLNSPVHHKPSSFKEKIFAQMPLPSELLTAADIDRISRVFASPKKKSKTRPTIRARAMLCPVVSKHFYNVRTNEVDPTDVRHDASFMGFRPTVSSRFPEAVAMRYRVLSVGKGSTNDVDLEKFGYCNYIGGKHATVFYDECSKSYELINYSQFGTYVNNVLYSNNVCIKRPEYNVSVEEKCANVEREVREIIDKKRKIIKSKKSPVDVKMAAVDYSDRAECYCTNNFEDLKKGWEGSAVLNHGSLIKFGCISFVFSIVESTP